MPLTDLQLETLLRLNQHKEPARAVDLGGNGYGSVARTLHLKGYVDIIGAIGRPKRFMITKLGKDALNEGKPMPPTMAQRNDPVYRLFFMTAANYVQGQEQAEDLAAALRDALSKAGYLVYKKNKGKPQ